MKLWVTGEAGFIARNLSDWCDTHNNHYVVNRLEEPYYDYWRSSILNRTHREINIFDPTLSRLIDESGADVIIHTASVEYDDAIKNPSLAIHTNIEGTYQVASIAKKIGVPVIYLSVIGKNVNLFSTTKHSGEEILKHTTDKFVILRPSIVYGRYDEKSHLAKIFSSIRGGATTFPLNIDAVRNYLYIDDLMDAMGVVFDNLYPMLGETFEIGNEAVSFDYLFGFMNEELNICPDCTFLQTEDHLGDIHADSSYIKSLGWKPQVSIREGIRKLIDL